MTFRRVFQLVVLLPCSFFLTQGNLNAQDEGARLEVHAADQAAASNSSEYRVHLRLKAESLNRFSPLPTAALPSVSTARPEALTSALAAATTIAAVPPPGFYPADLTHFFGGPVITSAQSHPVYVDCTGATPSSCWGGAPPIFLSDLGKSTFIHVADQYVGMTSDNRYTVGKSAIISYPILTALSDNDVLQIVHSAASTLGTGYNHIYHIFLPKGVDECFVGTTQCYSPDNLSTFVFCAYHGSVTFSDIGHVLFTVEPYQNVIGCSMLQPSPNGAIIDSTSSVLGHETFETITDPDPPTGWIAVTSNGVFGEEIGDLCPGVDVTAPYFEDPVTLINGHKYEVQPMYSNTYHACSFAP